MLAWQFSRMCVRFASNFAVSAQSDAVLESNKRAAAVPLPSPLAGAWCCLGFLFLQMSRQGLPHPENFLAGKISARPRLRIRFSQHRQRSSRCVVERHVSERKRDDGGAGGHEDTS